MGFLKRDDDSTPAPAQAAAAPGALTDDAPHAASYEAGSLAGIPESGRERIARMKQEVARGFFTSDLSVDEFLLVKQAGFEPLGLVLGSSIYHIGFQQAMWNQSQELAVLTQAMYHARELAMTRMEEEADQLGADGIVGVRLDIGRYEWGADLAEFISVGTAVRHRDGELHRAQRQVTDISEAAANPAAVRVPLVAKGGSAVVGMVLASPDRVAVVSTHLPSNRVADQTYVLWGLTSGAPIPLAVFDVVSQALPLRAALTPTQTGKFTGYAVSLEPGRHAPAAPTDVVASGHVIS